MTRTPEEVKQEIGAQIQSIWGTTPLVDPSAYASDPLVRLTDTFAYTISDLDSFREAWIGKNSLQFLEGAELDALASQFGFARKTGTTSKAALTIIGVRDCAVPDGTQFVDSAGRIWESVGDIKLLNRGAPVGFGAGIVCAQDVGAFSLSNHNLRYVGTDPNIYGATNGVMLEVGGEQESDSAFRSRIMFAGPNASVTGTDDAALSQIRAVDGVNFARGGHVDDCYGSGYMFVVNGGDDAQICETIKLHANLACLTGEVECDECTGARFQRPCAVVMRLKVYLNCQCGADTADTVLSAIVANAATFASQEIFRASDIARLSELIDYVDVTPFYIPLVGDGCTSPYSYTDPFTGETVEFGTSAVSTRCHGRADCSDAQRVIRLAFWEMPIVDADYIEIIDNCGDVVVACACG